MMRNFIVITSLMTASLMGGCQTVEGQAMKETAASLDSQQDMDSLMKTLKDVMQDQSISLGVGDPMTESRFTVLPKKLSPYETRTAVMPTAFEIMTDGQSCYLRKGKEGAGETYALPNVTCSRL